MKPHTYADGYGRWHAITPDTPRARENAVHAIAEELHQRGTRSDTLTEMKGYVEATITTRPAEQQGTAHFIEYRLP